MRNIFRVLVVFVTRRTRQGLAHTEVTDEKKDEMNAVLFASAFTMTAVAFAFVVLPLRRRIAGRLPIVVFPSVASAMLFGIALYAAIGRPDAALIEVPAQPALQSTDDSANKQKLASVDRLLAGLEERLQENPDDGKGWLLLAKSYDHLGRTEESLTAYARAKELGFDGETTQ